MVTQDLRFILNVIAEQYAEGQLTVEQAYHATCEAICRAGGGRY